MANRYWFGGTGSWTTSNTANWSAASALVFTASCSGTTLTTTGSPALVVGMTVRASAGTSLGTVVSGAANTWVVSIGGTYASQTMTAATAGASVPTTSDNVFFDSGSGASGSTITLTGALACLSFSGQGLSTNFNSTGTLNVAGSFTLASGNTWSATGTITFSSTTTGNTVTTNGVTISASITFNGIGGGWTLGSALTTTGTITLINGTFDTSSSGNYAVSASIFSGTGNTARTLNLNASTITLSGAATAWSFTLTTNLTFNAGTSTINLTSTSNITVSSGGLTYYNLTMSASSVNTTRTITGVNTFNNLTCTNASTAIGVLNLSFGANQTINGTLTLSGGTTNPGTNRLYIGSSTYGTQVTLTAAAVSLTDVDFSDVIGAGAASPFTGTRIGDAANNSGITFTTPKTVYFVGTTATSWAASQWATSSGGAVSSTNFPLPQDTATFDNNSLNASTTLTQGTGYNLPSIDASARTNLITLNFGFAASAYGSIILSSAVTLSGGAALTWQNRNTATITSAGVTWTPNITVNNITGTLKLLDAFVSSTTVNSLTLTSGTFDANGFNFTGAGKFTLTGTNTRTLAIGSGTWTTSNASTTTWVAAATGLTVTGTGTIFLTAATAKTFAGGDVNYGSVILNQGGAGALTISGSNTFGDITNTYGATGATSILFTAGTTQTLANFTASGTVGKLLTLNSTTAGTRFNLSKASGNVDVNYLNIKDSNATGGAGWYANTTSTDSGNNVNWNFSAAPAPVVSSIIYPIELRSFTERRGFY